MKRLFLTALSCVCLVTAAAFACCTAFSYRTERHNFDEIRQRYLPKAQTEASGQAAGAQAFPGEDPVQSLLKLRFDELKETHPDTAAWLLVPDAGISYPVMQGQDNEYYLHHDPGGNASYCGSIFMDADNAPDLTDTNTVIYGHNMRDGSMFAPLTQLKTPEAEGQEREFYIALPGCVRTYRIFSVREVDARSDAYTLRFETPQERRYWQETMLSEAKASEREVLQPDQRVVTLSTCTQDDAKRLIVQGVMTGD